MGVGFLGLQVETGKYQVSCGIFLNHFHCPVSVAPTLSGHMAPALPLSDLHDEILDLDVTAAAGLASDRLAISASSLATFLCL